jgi:hypothetical protein
MIPDMKKIYFLFFTLVFFEAGISCKREPIYKNPSAPIESRIKDLLGRMILSGMELASCNSR